MILQEPGRTNFDLNFKLLRVPVRVHPGFWIMGILLNLRNQINPIELALTIGVVFVSILVHEYGHALSGRYYGERSNSIVLYSMGGLCIPDSLNPKRWPLLWILLWGPFAGFLLGGLVLGAWFALARAGIAISPLAESLLYYAVFINLIWGCINFVPVFPLDGGQIMREIVRWKFPNKGDVFVFTFSMVAAIIVTVLLLVAHLLLGTGLLGPILFGSLAFQNYAMRKQLQAMGEFYVPEESTHREPWEQDADWWKKN